MIEEVVNSILEAEDEAKKRIAVAEEKAAKTVAEAEARADAIRSQAASDNKKYQQEQLANADVEAKKLAEQVLGELRKQADADVRELSANLDKAVAKVLESI